MEKLRVTGGARLAGEVRIQGAKNAVLPLLGAVLLTKEPVFIHNCPHISDVENMCGILRYLGACCEWRENGLWVCTEPAGRFEMPQKLSKELRSSIFMLGAVLARFGRAVFYYPGGCEIGSRPIDLHLKGLRGLNVEIVEEGGLICCDGSRMCGGEILLDYPSVGATENIMMAATAAKGRTVIRNTAREPEVADLARALNRMGASVFGAGSSTITVEGGQRLCGMEFVPVPDRIAAGTYLCGAAMTGGDVTVTGVIPEHMRSILHKLGECGCAVTVSDDAIRAIGPKRPQELTVVETLPYPGFPTDMQAAFLALCTVAEGTSVLVENVFDNRFRTASELARMNANITVKDRMAIVRGVKQLSGAEVTACDLRGGAALVLAGLRAAGTTVVSRVECIDRGYECIEGVLCSLGAQVERVPG